MSTVVYILPPIIILILIIVFIIIRKPNTSSTSTNYKGKTSVQKANDLISTRGSRKDTPQELAAQLDTGVAKEDIPPSKTTQEVVKDSMSQYRVLAGSFAGQIALDNTVEKITENIQKQMTKSTRVVLNEAGITAERSSQKLSVKLVTNSAERAAITGAKASVKSGTRAAASATKLAVSSAMKSNPYTIAAEMAVGYVTNVWDAIGAGGFNNLKTMDTLNTMRDTFESEFNSSFGENIPLVYGPLDTITEDEYYKQVSDEMLKLINEDKNRPSDPPDSYYDTIGQKAVENLCKSKTGFISNDKCSYKKEDCVSPWPLQVGDTYYEYKDGVCQARPSLMRQQCESMGFGVSYNKDTGSCNLTREYCGRYAGSAVLKNGDCEISEGQQIAENIFGTAFTRSIINIFDFKNNYKACPPGTNIPYELIAVGLTPFSTQFLCGGSRCKDDEEMMMETDAGGGRKLGGICYKKCRDGYTSRWGNDGSTEVAGMCYEKCPDGYRGDSMACWRDLDVKTNPPSEPRCPDGWSETSKGMCQKNCTDEGFTQEYSGVCYHNSVDTDLLVKVPNYGDCPSGYRTEPITCFKDAKCNTFWRDGTGVVTQCSGPRSIERPKTCPYGYTEEAGMCYAQSRPFEVAKSIIEVGVCEPGHFLRNGLCYRNCEDLFGPSYYESAQGLCERGIIRQERKYYSRKPEDPAYRIFPKERVTSFPSTSEEDFKNSTVGKYIQGGINGIRDGDIEKIGQSIAGIMITGNPAVISMGTQDLADMGYQGVISGVKNEDPEQVIKSLNDIYLAYDQKALMATTAGNLIKSNI